jgi:5-methylcytosine-specific restriction endonuclease McrA
MPRKSTGVYPENWTEIANRVKDKAGWKCIRCGHPHDRESGHVLTVHHLDLNPANCRWWNLTALCQRCHLRIQGKVIMERTWFLEHSEWFKPYVAGFYAHYFGLPDDRESVMAHVEELIALGQGRKTP